MSTLGATTSQVGVCLCGRPRRRRAGARPSAVGVVGQGADAGGGHRALQPGARPHRPGAARSMPTPARSRARAATRTTSPTCAMSSGTPTCCLVEHPNGDFAPTMVRHLLIRVRPSLLAVASDLHRRDVAASRQVGEGDALPRAPCGRWVIRLGDGTAESHPAPPTLAALWPYTGELFELTRGGGAGTDGCDRAAIGRVGAHRGFTARRNVHRPAASGCRPAGAAGGTPST